MARIRKAGRLERSDYMSRKMDERLDDLEDRLTALYSNAANEVKSNFTDFTKDFEAADKRMSARVIEGSITEEQYIIWRKEQLLQSALYQVRIDSLVNILVNTDVAAMAIVNDELPSVIAESYNFVQSLGWSAAADRAGLSVGTFQIYNARSVQTLIRDNPDLFPSVDIPEDMRWNKDRINREITQGIIQGDPIDRIAERLQRVTTMDEGAAIRNARTAMTGAENMGRRESSDRLKSMGIPVDDVWSATHDNRTRETHRLMDETKANADGLFGEGIIATLLRYPGDPNGDPEEIYNCRCRLIVQLRGIDHSKDGELYEQFMRENYPDDWEELKRRGRV